MSLLVYRFLIVYELSPIPPIQCANEACKSTEVTSEAAQARMSDELADKGRQLIEAKQIAFQQSNKIVLLQESMVQLTQLVEFAETSMASAEQSIGQVSDDSNLEGVTGMLDVDGRGAQGGEVTTIGDVSENVDASPLVEKAAIRDTVWVGGFSDEDEDTSAVSNVSSIDASTSRLF